MSAAVSQPVEPVCSTCASYTECGGWLVGFCIVAPGLQPARVPETWPAVDYDDTCDDHTPRDGAATGGDE